MSSQGRANPLADSPRTTWHRLLRWGWVPWLPRRCSGCRHPPSQHRRIHPRPLRRWSNSRRWCSQPLSMSRSRGRDTCDETNKGYFTEDPFTVSYQCTGFVVTLMATLQQPGTVPTTTVRSRTRSSVRSSTGPTRTILRSHPVEGDHCDVRAQLAGGRRRFEGTPLIQSVRWLTGVSVSGEPTGRS